MTAARDDSREFIEMRGPDGPRLVHLPGLDGLRGVAVAAVVLYHMGFQQARGGYLGVSTFFTLSGFLITSLLVNELKRDGRPSLRRFWERRFRRLMPAALVTLLLIAVVFGRTVATADQRLSLRGDVISALFYMANWRFILAGTSYGDLSASASPVLHFWSLSIEEQFYIVFPVIVMVTWLALRRLASRRLLGLTVVLTVLALVGAVQPLILDLSTNTAYLGSTVRASEILIGGLLAITLSGRRVRHTIVVRRPPRVAITAAAVVAAAVQIYWIATVDQSSTWLYRGGLPLFAVLTCVLITVAAIPVGPFRSVLASAPLRWLGTRSYGIYLFHWPLLLAARQMYPTAVNTVRATVAVLIALVLSEVSYRFVEMPVRTRRWPADRGALRVALGAFLVVAVVAALPVPVDRTRLSTDFDSDTQSLDDLGGDVMPSTVTSSTTTVMTGGDQGFDSGDESVASATIAPPPPPAPVGVMPFGDSTAVLVALGMATSIMRGTTDQLAYLRGWAELGCSVSRFELQSVQAVGRSPDKCREWPREWGRLVDEDRPDVAMLITSAWEIVDAQIPGVDGWTSIGRPEADEFIRSELEQAVDLLSSQGALVIVWLWPPFAPWADDQGRPGVAHQHDPARTRRLHELMGEIAAARPDSVRLFDFEAYLGPDRLADPAVRPDGLHVPAEVMEQLFATGLGGTLQGIFDEWWRANHG